MNRVISDKSINKTVIYFGRREKFKFDIVHKLNRPSLTYIYCTIIISPTLFLCKERFYLNLEFYER